MKTWLALTVTYIVMWCLNLYTDFYDGPFMVIPLFFLYGGTLFHISATVVMGSLHLGLLLEDLKYRKWRR